MGYVDGYVLAVPTARKAEYLRLAEDVAPLFLKHGATSLRECWGDDVPEGKLTSFPMAVQCKPDETVVFSWITWPDRATRDAGNRKVMEEIEALGMDAADNPFDGARMIIGGFETLLEA